MVLTQNMRHLVIYIPVYVIITESRALVYQQGLGVCCSVSKSIKDTCVSTGSALSEGKLIWSRAHRGL